MATNVSATGQAAPPGAAHEAAGIRSLDRVTAPARAEGGVLIEREASPGEDAAIRARLEALVRRRPLAGGPLGGRSADDVIRLLRGEN